jgi:[acyl-carrier-protein] S-malonyltransferase
MGTGAGKSQSLRNLIAGFRSARNRAKMATAMSVSTQSSSNEKIAFLFPGQGSQTVGMGRDLAENFTVARQTFEEADDALGFSISRLCFDGPAEQLKQTEFTQPAIFTVSVAVDRVLRNHNMTPTHVAGHSLGEYSAAVAAGMIGFADAIKALQLRGRFMQEAVPEGVGAMAAILGLSAQPVVDLCIQAQTETGEPVSAANLNSPEQIVISGSAAAVARASELAKPAGAKKVVALHVSAPFHCALMQPAQDRLADVLEGIHFEEAAFPLVCNVDAKIVTDGGTERDALIRQVTAPVRWVESMQLLIAEGVTQYFEVGPGKVLTGLLRQIDRSQHCSHIEDAATLRKALEPVHA